MEAASKRFYQRWRRPFAFWHASGAEPGDNDVSRPEITGRKIQSLLSKSQIAERIGVSIWTVDRIRERDPDFPPTIWLTDKTCRWESSAVEQWLASRPHGGKSPGWSERVPPMARRYRARRGQRRGE